MSDPTTLLKARYGAASVEAVETWNDCLSTLLFHRSVRSYQSTNLPPGTLETLIAAAQSAASSSNLQTWSVVAVTDPEGKERLAQLARGQAHIRQCPLFLVWLADLDRLTRIAEKQGLQSTGLDYLEMFLMGVVDATLAAQNAAIAAESLGLGTVYIGALRNQPEQVAAELHLPPRVFPVFGLCIGYPDPAVTTAIKPRLSQSVVLHRETYHELQDEWVDQYNAIMDRFYEEQQMQSQGAWSHHSVKRIESPSSLSGRDRLREALNTLGFSLY